MRLVYLRDMVAVNHARHPYSRGEKVKLHVMTFRWTRNVFICLGYKNSWVPASITPPSPIPLGLIRSALSWSTLYSCFIVLCSELARLFCSKVLQHIHILSLSSVHDMMMCWMMYTCTHACLHIWIYEAKTMYRYLRYGSRRVDDKPLDGRVIRFLELVISQWLIISWTFLWNMNISYLRGWKLWQIFITLLLWDEWSVMHCVSMVCEIHKMCRVKGYHLCHYFCLFAELAPFPFSSIEFA